MKPQGGQEIDVKQGATVVVRPTESKLQIPKLDAHGTDTEVGSTSADIRAKNEMYVQADAVAIGVMNGASGFLPVFLARLGASENQVGLLTAFPG